MSLFAVSTFLTIASVAYSFYNQQQAKKAQEKARREAEQRADLAKGFQFTVEGQAKSLPIVYGRNKVGGVRVHFKVNSGYNFAEPVPGAIVFESKKQPDNAEPLVYKLTNTSADWTGTWSLVPSSKYEFLWHPGWIVTKEDINSWKYPDRGFSEDTISYLPPSVDFVFCPFQFGTNTSIKPNASLHELGFKFPERTGTEPVLNKSRSGEKNEYFFVQQAVAYSGLSNVYTADVDQKPYSFTGYSYGLRMHIHPNGGIADPLMTANDATRANAKFNKTAYATMCFKLNRDDPQYNGTPEVQFYVEGNKVKEVIRSGLNYSLSAEKIYTNNSALVLLDYLTNTNYGKSLPESAIDLESFYKAAKICNIKVASSVDKKGALWLTKGGTRDIRLYECNLALDSASSFRDNIQKILDTMGLATLVWSEGKYRLNLPYSYVYDTTVNYQVDDIVQVTIENKNRLFRCIQSNTNKHPLTNSQYWIEDVIDSDIRDINDEDLLNGSEVLISWPNSDSKLNFATVRFLNEEKDFSEDTVSWPEKEPTDASDTIYQQFLSEDNNVQLEAEIFESGCTTPYHAKALAEQRVRASRDTVQYTFKAVARVFKLEPGDIFGFSSSTFSIPYSLLKVDDIETEEGGVVKVTASTFDANLLAWNVPDNFYVPLRNNYEGYMIKQAKNLRMLVGASDNKTSNYTLTWESAEDNRVNRYIVKYCSDSLQNITSSSAWRDLGTTYANAFELPALDGDYTFTVVSLSRDGRPAPYKNLFEGSSWPMISYKMSSAFLDRNSIKLDLSNTNHKIICDSSNNPLTYVDSGTEVRCFYGFTSLVYDGIGTTPGTFKINVTAKNIASGTVSAGSDCCVIGPAGSMIADSAELAITVSGTTPLGAYFIETTKQYFNKYKSGAQPLAYYIEMSSPVVFKDARSSALTGSYSSVTLKGKRRLNGVLSDFGYVTVTPNNSGESTPVASIQLQSASDSGVSSYTVKLYSDAAKSILLDEEYLSVVFRGEKGSGAISAFISNSTHALPADSVGNVVTYENSGTDLFVYEGSARLEYNPTWTSQAGQYKVTASGSNISLGSTLKVLDYFRIANHFAMTQETAAVAFTITGKSTEGIPFEIFLTQTLLKARRGSTIIDVRLSNDYFVFTTDENGTISSYSGTGTQVAVYEGDAKLTYDGIGNTNGSWSVSSVGTGITASTSFSQINGTDAQCGVASNMTQDSAYITFTVTGKTTTGNSFTLTRKQNIEKRKQGVTGSKTASVYLYQWATTKPANPTGTSQFNWSTLVNSGYTKANGATDYWGTAIPTNPGTPLLKLWRAEKSIVALNTASVSSVDWTTSPQVSDVTQNGQAGLNVADATLYKWSPTIPAAPVGSNTFTWSSGSFDAVSTQNSNDGWSKSPGAAIAGYTLWAAVVRLVDSVTNSTTVINWVSSTVTARAYAGGNGASYRTAYAKSATATATSANIDTSGSASFPANDSWSLSGTVWSASVPTLAAGEFMWQSDGIYNPATNVTTWSTPYWSSLKVGNLSAISANMGTLTSGKIRSNDGKFIIDLDNKTISIEV